MKEVFIIMSILLESLRRCGTVVHFELVGDDNSNIRNI